MLSKAAKVSIKPLHRQPSIVYPTPPPTTSNAVHESVVFAVKQAIDNHDWRTLTQITVDGLVNYFGHRHVTNAYIAQDMQNDARTYEWQHSTAYPNTFTHEVSDQYSSHWSGPMLYDSINGYNKAQERNGKLHKAMTRLTVGYVLDSAGTSRDLLADIESALRYRCHLF
jgi:hypothetical protein